MRCTSRRKVSLLLALCLLLTGCSSQNYQLSYNPNSTVSSFSMNGVEDAKVADAFASYLCVTASDVLENTQVDMEQAGAAGLFNVTDASVLYAKNIHAQMYPASLTKVMTALIALKYGRMEDVITVTSNAKITESGAQTCGLAAGDTLTMDQALHALLINSANDAAVAIAEHIGGSVEGFADMMNEEAKALGATNSHFVNPHGLHADDHYVTAYDLYLIFNEALKNEKFTEIIQTTSYESNYSDNIGDAKSLSFETTNQYLKGVYDAPDNVTVIGGKTGTTNAAQNCLIIYVKDTEGKSYIAVVLRSKERGILYEEMSDLLDEIKK